jgi:Zn-dependent alcohol dehydrogenase
MSRDVLILACAVSAGVHAALAPQHATFVPAVIALGVLAVGLARSPAPLLVDGAVVVLGGLIAAYTLAATTGIPVVHPDREPVTSLALATKAIEALGLLAALELKGATRWLTDRATVRSLSH